ncbi:MAG: hypothetical protein Q8O41_05255 [Candidatus Methanoperedens sp.]|nr:hypothetical protein [Candidatus Methanoperedens sp.]
MFKPCALARAQSQAGYAGLSSIEGKGAQAQTHEAPVSEKQKRAVQEEKQMQAKSI